MTKDELKEKIGGEIDNLEVDIDSLTDEDLEDVAGGGCSCWFGSDNCSNGSQQQEIGEA